MIETLEHVALSRRAHQHRMPYDIRYCRPGNLDSHASAELLSFLKDSTVRTGQSVVIVTHDPRAAAYSDRVVLLADGAVAGELEKPTADSVLERIRNLGA